jgi:hypothetical protein
MLRIRAHQVWQRPGENDLELVASLQLVDAKPLKVRPLCSATITPSRHSRTGRLQTRQLSRKPGVGTLAVSTSFRIFTYRGDRDCFARDRECSDFAR